jgi:hypothetical protein
MRHLRPERTNGPERVLQRFPESRPANIRRGELYRGALIGPLPEQVGRSCPVENGAALCKHLKTVFNALRRIAR